VPARLGPALRVRLAVHELQRIPGVHREVENLDAARVEQLVQPLMRVDSAVVAAVRADAEAAVHPLPVDQ
jgi:hypothetical protein